MGFFDDISKKLTQVGQEVLNQGTALTDSARNKMRMSELEKQINIIYAELGKRLYPTIKDAPTPEYEEFVNRLNTLTAEYDKLKDDAARASSASSAVACPKCGGMVPMTNAFCNFCGAQMPKAAPAAAPTMTYLVCPSCGRQLPAGTSFCTGCGTDVRQTQPVSSSIPLGQMASSSGSFATPASIDPIPQPAQAAPSLTLEKPAQAADGAVSLDKQPESSGSISLEKK